MRGVTRLLYDTPYVHFNSIASIVNYKVCIISEIFTIEFQYSFILHVDTMYIMCVHSFEKNEICSGVWGFQNFFEYQKI